MSAKFRKKPVVVEAVQLRSDTVKEVIEFTGAGKLADGKPEVVANPVSGEIGLIIPTLEGNMTAKQGDWIIKGVKGEFCPCAPDIFEQTYTPVDDDHEDAEAVAKCERCSCDVPIKSVVCSKCSKDIITTKVEGPCDGHN